MKGGRGGKGRRGATAIPKLQILAPPLVDCPKLQPTETNVTIYAFV